MLSLSFLSASLCGGRAGFSIPAGLHKLEGLNGMGSPGVVGGEDYLGWCEIGVFKLWLGLPGLG